MFHISNVSRFACKYVPWTFGSLRGLGSPRGFSFSDHRKLYSVTSAKGSQKSEFYMLAFDWLEQTDKIGCNIFPARMNCADLELWCQIVWEHFPQLCVIYKPWRRQRGNMFMTNTIFLKWGILNVPFCSIFVPFHFNLIIITRKPV